jgi:hypothetical protein
MYGHADNALMPPSAQSLYRLQSHRYPMDTEHPWSTAGTLHQGRTAYRTVSRILAYCALRLTMFYHGCPLEDENFRKRSTGLGVGRKTEHS